MRISMKQLRAIVIAAFVCALSVSIDADRFAGANHRSDRVSAASGTVHAAAIRTLRPRLAGRGLAPVWRYGPDIGPGATPPVHFLASARIESHAIDASCGSSASLPFSARAPPAA